MKQYRMEQLQNGCWCVWRSGGTVNAAVPTRTEAERLVKALKSREKEEFDLPAYLLGNIYPQMDEGEKEKWNLIEAECLAHDLLLEGIDADPDEIYELIAEFIEQDAEEL